MRFKTVLAVSALFAVMLAVAVLGPSSDVSDAASQRWESSDCSGLTVEYTDGNTYLVIVLDNDPGLGVYDVIVGGKVLKASGSDGKRVGVNMGTSLDKNQNYTVIATPNGAAYHCTLSYLQFYDVAVTAEPSAGGTVSGAEEYKAGEQATVTAETSEGYSFGGWFIGGERVSIQPSYSFSVSADTDCVAKFIKNKHSVTYQLDGQEYRSFEDIEYGDSCTVLEKAVKKGYNVTDWTTDDVTVTDGVFSMPDRDVTFTATSVKGVFAYTISYVDAKGVTVAEPVTGSAEYESVISAEIKTVAGYDAPSEQKTITISDDPSENAVQYVYAPKSYNVVYKVDGSEVFADKADYNSSVTVRERYAKEGYTVSDWLTDDVDVTDGVFSMPAGDVTFTATSYANTRTITFDTDGGSEIASIIQDVGTAVSKPADPIKEGYTFSRWLPEIPGVMPSDDLTVVAQWTVNTYTITFDTLGGSAVAAVSQAYGTVVTVPADPTKEGFTFVKWDQEIPGTVPARNMTISAVWAANATVDETGKTEVVLDKDTDAFVLPADTKTVTVTVDDNISVVIQDTSSIGAGTAVIAKVEEIPNTSEVEGTACAYEVTVTKADDQPITGKMQVTLPYTPEKGKVPAVYWQNGSALEKMRVISHTSDSVTFETTHNSTYVVVAEPVSEDSGATFMLYLGLLMVVGIVLSMLIGFNYYRRKA